ncbi:MAG: hypothetical protein ACK5TT_05380, partial [Lysobacteraceae bacterium]
MTDAASPTPKIRPLNIVIAVVAIVAGTLLAWGGWTLHGQRALVDRIAEIRTEAGTTMGEWITNEQARFDALRRATGVAGALRAGDVDAARVALAGDWVGIEAVEVHPADLAAAWAAPAQFGYGKLGLLTSALD